VYSSFLISSYFISSYIVCAVLDILICKAFDLIPYYIILYLLCLDIMSRLILCLLACFSTMSTEYFSTKKHHTSFHSVLINMESVSLHAFITFFC
jgi:hypothetical protein